MSRPFWMWGAEMGANECGLSIGNEAVFTRVPVSQTGLTGMDLLRLTLERAATAAEGVDVLSALLERYGQGGRAGYRNKSFSYHNSFILADAREAWVLETAGEHWAAARVRGIRTISNVLTIGKDFDRLSPRALAYARERRWCRNAADFDWAACYGDRAYKLLTGGDVRRSCTRRALERAGKGEIRASVLDALRDHGDSHPTRGWRMTMTCAHASWWPTRTSGQTTGSMVSQLAEGRATHYFTGTSSPCLSVFKPFEFARANDTLARPGRGYDDDSLFWLHERLHRGVLADYDRCRARFESDRAGFESDCLAHPERGWAAHCDAHVAKIREWTWRVRSARLLRRPDAAFRAWWALQNRADRVPPP